MGAGSPSDSNRRGGRKGRGGELRAHGCRCIFASAQMGIAWAVRGPGPGGISPPGRASRWEGVSEATPLALHRMLGSHPNCSCLSLHTSSDEELTTSSGPKFSCLFC